MKNNIILTIMGFAVLLLAGCGGGTFDSITRANMEAEVPAYFKSADTDGNGSLDYKEASTFALDKFGYKLSQKDFDRYASANGLVNLPSVEIFLVEYLNDTVDVIDTNTWTSWSDTGVSTSAVTTNRSAVTEGDFSVIYSDTTASTKEQTRSNVIDVAASGRFIDPNTRIVLRDTAKYHEQQTVTVTSAIAETFVSRTRNSGTLDTLSAKAFSNTVITTAGTETSRATTGNVGTWTTVAADLSAPKYQEKITQTRTIEESISFSDDTVSKDWTITYNVVGADDRTDGVDDNLSVVNATLTGTDTGISQAKTNELVNTKTESQIIDNPTFVSVKVDSELSGTVPSEFESTDANEDGYITRAEAKAKWDSMTDAEKSAYLSSILGSVSVSKVDAIMSGTNYFNTLFQDVILSQLNGINGNGASVGVVDYHSGDSGFHGEHVKSIIDLVAPGTSSSAIDVASDASIGAILDLITADITANGTDAFNLSLGLYYADYGYDLANDLEYYEDFSSTYWDAVLIVAAGNDHRGDQTYHDHDGDPLTPEITNGIKKDCSVLEKCNALALNLIYNSNETVIVVGAMNDEGTALDTYSTPAGVLKEYYIAAPVWESSGGGRGTSYAAPVVAGIAALLIDNMNDDDPIAVKTKILESADGLGDCETVDQGTSCTDDTYGHGRLNVSRALAPVGGLK